MFGVNTGACPAKLLKIGVKYVFLLKYGVLY